jgi:transcriptional regulator with XRE-family HTH domain
VSQAESRSPQIAPPNLGDLLRRHRRAAGLTQESLAERAGLSVHGIQKLEAGASHPYRDTVDRLIVALDLRGDDQVHFRSAARPAPRQNYAAKSDSASAKDAVSHNLPFPTTSYVARAGEIAGITQRLRESRLLTITGAGGARV